VACEPEPGNHRLLRANLALNGVEDRVLTLRFGISATSGTTTLVSSVSCPGMSFVALDKSAYEAEETRLADLAASDPNARTRDLFCTEIELVSLDSLVEDGRLDPADVGLVWIDAEGHEGAVLQGASTLTSRGAPLVMEFHPPSIEMRSDLEGLYSFLERDYTHFCDLRRPEREAGRQQGQLHPTGELREVGARFVEAGRFTDLLLLRLPDASADR
jgi:FkbM family methyltransferase